MEHPILKNTHRKETVGCFHGSCKVLMGDGSYKLVKNIQRGDTVVSFNRRCVKVLGVMITNLITKKTDLVQIGELLITPYHPVLFDNHWTFPKDIVKPHSQPCTKLYTFVLEKDHILLINSVPCVSLGHNINAGPVVSHDYFGTDRILRDLEKFPSWRKKGIVELTSYNFIRNAVTNRVEGIDIVPHVDQEYNTSNQSLSI